jgi:hypothetical protein
VLIFNGNEPPAGAAIVHSLTDTAKAAMGLLWLSTVPQTNAIVAQAFGAHFLGMLSG